MGLMIGILALVSLAACVFLFTMAILRVIGRGLLFRKAGIPWWHSLIPVLNAYDWFVMAGFRKFLTVIGTVGNGAALFWVTASLSSVSSLPSFMDDFLLILICTEIVLRIVSYFFLPKRFGKSRAYGLLFLLAPDVMYLMTGIIWKKDNG